MSISPLFLPTLSLNDDERDLVTYHIERLLRFRGRNRVKEAYYEGRQRVRNLGASLPENLRNIEVAVGWPATGVDVLEERIDWLGWVSDTGETFGLDDVYTENSLDVDSSLGHHDSLITGTGFVVVGRGFEGEPDTLVTVESPNKTTGEWDFRTRRLSSALSVDDEGDFGEPEAVTLYLPNENIRAARVGGRWVLVERDAHNLGRVMVAALPNRLRGSRQTGRSEITPALRAYTDMAVRTMLGMDVHREFYQAPQRYIRGAEEGMFKKGDGSIATGWETVLGRVLALPRDEDGELPEVGQFPASTPTGYLEHLRGLAQMVSAEAAIPANYLGFSSDNPPSADAIRAMEARLIKRAERRQAVFGRAWREVGALALLARDGEIPDGFFSTVGNSWRDPATPTRSAAADEVSKYVAAGVLPADSVVTYSRMGLTPMEIKTLETEKRKARAESRVTALAGAAQAARAETAAPVAAAPAEAADGE